MQTKLNTPHNIGTLAKRYKVSRATMAKIVKRHAEKIGNYEFRMFTPKQLQIIEEILGPPYD